MTGTIDLDQRRSLARRVHAAKKFRADAVIERKDAVCCTAYLLIWQD
jgi:hypothetical protein